MKANILSKMRPAKRILWCESQCDK